MTMGEKIKLRVSCLSLHCTVDMFIWFLKLKLHGYKVLKNIAKASPGMHALRKRPL